MIEKGVTMQLDILACYLIPAYTLLFAGEDQWLTTNFSVLGSTLEMWPIFALWAAVVGLYFNHYLRYVIGRLDGGSWMYRGVALSASLLFCSVTTPYLPDIFPFRAVLHVLFGVSAALLLLAILLVLIGSVWRRDPLMATPYLLAIGGISLVSLVLLAMAGIVSSALEIFLVISNTLLVRKMVRQQWD